MTREDSGEVLRGNGNYKRVVSSVPTAARIEQGLLNLFSIGSSQSVEQTDT
jgi:hypothetical protein